MNTDSRMPFFIQADLSGVINGVVVQHVTGGYKMKTIKGFDSLLAIQKGLPNVGGFFVDKNFSNDRSVIKNAEYYLAESEEEDEDMEYDYATWIEYPTFKAIIENKLEHHPAASNEELLDAVIYYLEMDDFLD